MGNGDPIKKFVRLVLSQAHKDDATDVVVGPVDAATLPVRYKVGGTWHDIAPPPARVRAGVIRELERLASLREGPFPKEGKIEITTESGPSQWDLKAPTAEGEWLLSRRT